MSNITLAPADASAASTTNFKISNGDDLNTIFQPISLGTQIGYNTGFKVGGTDLRSIFTALSSSAGSATGFNVNGNDLNTIFEPINLGRELIVHTAGASSNDVIFSVVSGETMTVILVGGGGGGSSNARTASAFSGGNGGAGGKIFIQNFGVGKYTISYNIGGGGAGSTTEDVVGGTGGSSTVTINGTTYTATGGAGGNVNLDGVGSQGTKSDAYNYNHGGTAAVKNYSGDTTISRTDGEGGFVLTVDGTTYNIGGGGAGGISYYTDKDVNASFPGVGGNGGYGGGGKGGDGNNNEKINNGISGGAGFLCVVVS